MPINRFREAVEVSLSTIERTRKTFVREGLDCRPNPEKAV